MEKKQGNIITVRFVFRTKDMPEDNLGVSYFSGSSEELKKRIELITADDQVVSCFYEYQHEIDLSKVGYAVPVKQDVDLSEVTKDEA